jgi:general secretion pathway protein J
MSRDARGFTLLEVVIAMTALALVTVICYGAFHLGIRAVERGEVAVVAAQRLRVATDVLIRQIKSTVPYKARNRDEDEYVFFMGTATSMAFITAAGMQGGGGLERVVYQVMDDPPRLVMSESPFFSTNGLGRDAVDKPGENSAVLLEGFQSLKFEYLFYEGVEPEWRTEWNGHDEEDLLPVAVRVLVDGIPGLEVKSWGQEIPVMAAQYGDEGGAGYLDDEDEDTDSESDAEDAGRPPSRNGSNSGDEDDSDD